MKPDKYFCNSVVEPPPLQWSWSLSTLQSFLCRARSTSSICIVWPKLPILLVFELTRNSQILVRNVNVFLPEQNILAIALDIHYLYQLARKWFASFQNINKHDILYKFIGKWYHFQWKCDDNNLLWNNSKNIS